jgi:anaerobic selenocysteine-containing dehydrogenase
MSDQNETETRLSREKVVAGALVGAGALSLPRFLAPSDALAAEEGQAMEAAWEAFLGQADLPVPPANAKVHTSACQYCNVGCGYKIYTWPVAQTPRTRRRAGLIRRSRSPTGSPRRW